MANQNRDHVAIDLALATSPNEIEAVPELAKEILVGASMLDSGGIAALNVILIKARTLVQALETPRETMTKHCWAQDRAAAGLITGVDTGFLIIMAKGGDKPQRVKDLAEATGIEAALLSRLMHHLGAMEYRIETGVDESKTNNFTKSLCLPMIGDGYVSM